jgi:putative glycosyltransferase (TIGR04372 family)
MNKEEEQFPDGNAKDFDLRKRLWARLKADPDGYETNRDVGLYCASRRNLIVGAEPYLLKALACGRRVDADDHEMLFSLGEVYKVLGRLDRAGEVYAQLCQRFPAVLHNLYLAGDVRYFQGRLEAASEIYATASRLVADHAQHATAAAGLADARILAPSHVLCAHIGEIAHKLDLFVKARTLGLIKDFEAIVLAPEKDVANMPLLDCYRAHLTVFTDPEAIEACTKRLHGCRHYVDYLKVPSGLTLHRELAYGVVQRMWSDRGLKAPIAIPEAVQERGWATLRGLGVPDGAWFAALHVREPGFFYEDVPWNHNRHRNGRVEDYRLAIEAITARGGWVLRMGDPSMKPLPPMPQVVDYALSEVRSKEMDVFGLSQCRFFVGTASGPMNVARAFCVPVLATNYFPAGTWPFSAGDLFIHKLHRAKDGGRWLSLEEALRPPLLACWNPIVYEKHGIEVVDNSPEDIRDATEEMLDLLDGIDTPSQADVMARKRYRFLGDPYGLGFLLPVARSFLAHHPHLLGNG